MSPVLPVGAALACLAVAFGLRRWARSDKAEGLLTARSTRSARTITGPAGVAGPASSTAAAGGGRGMVALLARHRWARRSLGAVAAVLVLAAAGVAAYPFLTDQYTETLQTRLSKELVEGKTQVAYRTGKVEVGDSLTRIRIPKIGLDTIVVEGTTVSALKAGAGHFTKTPLPCDPGNVAIAGHRTTYGKPFADLEKLAVGDEITLETPIGSCTYEVSTAPFAVAPSDTWVVAPTKDPQLTLTTCHPEGSARQRLVLHAKRVSNHLEPAT
jgi:sortase A